MLIPKPQTLNPKPPIPSSQPLNPLQVDRMLAFIERPLKEEQKLRLRRAANIAFASVLFFNAASVVSSWTGAGYSAALAADYNGIVAAYASGDSVAVTQLLASTVPLLNGFNLAQV